MEEDRDDVGWEGSRRRVPWRRARLRRDADGRGKCDEEGAKHRLYYVASLARVPVSVLRP